jgi:fatty acid desaturase
MTPERAPRAAGLGDLLGRLLGEARQLVADYSLLAVLDGRRAAMQLAWLLSSGLVVAVLLVTAWLALVVALMVWLFEERMSWPAAIAIAGVMNIVGAGALLFWMRSLVVEKPFTALLRQLKGEDAPDVPRS